MGGRGHAAALRREFLLGPLWHIGLIWLVGLLWRLL